jgi:hypothetical protein
MSVLEKKNKSSISGNFISLLEEQKVKDINKLYSKITKNSEFELIFNSRPEKQLGYETYINLLKFLNKRYHNQKNKIVSENSLDIVYRKDEASYRLTINGTDDINYIIEPFHKYENHVTLKTLALKTLEKDNAVMTLMKKIKERENLVDIEDFNMRIRLSEEVPLTKKEFDLLQSLTNRDSKNISFRLKQRVSFYILGDISSKTYIKIDMTITKMSNIINKLNSSIPNYELEIELMSSDNLAPKDTSLLDKIFSETELLLKVMNKSNFLISETNINNVIKNYARITNLQYDKITNLDTRKSVSLEIQHVTENLPNKYAVTDKADGDRYFLIIADNHVYLISNNLAVKDTGIVLSKELNKYNDTILDGEFIFLPTKNRHIFMVFDCLFHGGKDVRKTQELMIRLSFADEVISNCFTNKNHKGFIFKEYTSSNKEFNLDNLLKFHESQIREFTNNLNFDIEQDKKYPLIRRKYFIPVTGAVPWEIFAYSSMLWNKHTSDKSVQTPYQLDGLIYQALNQDYNTSMRDSKLLDYKWKPKNKNSIDFYITFTRDRETGKILTVYDNSVDEFVKNKPYKICNLHVGKQGKYGMEPTLFREKENGYLAHIFLKNGEAVDIEGNLLMDNTVVEFYYDDNPELDEKFRWVPIRTRYDKTEQVQKYKRDYGNYIDIAMKVWRSMINPVLISDFDELAMGNNEKTGKYFYDNKLEEMRKKIGHELILTATREDQYFQVRNDLTDNMRKFHNWVKSILLYTICMPQYQNDRKLSILDLAHGKGQDIMKFYYCNVAYAVCLDIDKTSLTSAVDGAISRYNKFKKTKDAFPKMDFIHADCGAILDYENQYKALGGMNKENKDLMEKYFPTDINKKHQFDRISCQFALHYFLKSKETWDNFKTNLRNHLKPGGYFLVSASDGNAINNVLKDKEKYTVYYNNEKGEKKILFEMIRKYPQLDENKEFGLSNAVDIYLAWIFQEGTYMTEYLVDKNFLRRELLEDCDLELVDTDLYSNIMTMQKDFFANYSQFEEKTETKNTFAKVFNYYTETNINKGCYEQTKLFRYFVFRRKDVLGATNKIKKPKISRMSNKQKGGALDLMDDSKYIIQKSEETGNSLCQSIFKLLKSHKLIPATYEIENLFNDLKLSVKHDKDIEEDYLKNISKNMYISHQIKTISGAEKTKIFIDGLNIFIVEKDCNGNYDVDIIEGKNKPNKKTKTIVLYKDNSTYMPIYIIEEINGENKRRGIFDKDDDIIKDLIELFEKDN